MESSQPRPFNWPLRSKFGLGFLLTILIPLMIIAIVVVILRYQSLQNQAEDSVILLTELNSETLATQLSELKVSAEQIALQTPDIAAHETALNTGNTNLEALQASRDILERIWTSNLSLIHLWLVRPNLTIIAQTGFDGIELNPDTAFQIGQQPAESVLVGLYQGQQNNPQLDILLPIRVEGRNLGYVVMTQDLNRSREANDNLPNLLNILESQPDLQNMPEADLFLLDTTGLLLASNQRGVLTFENYRQHPATRTVLPLNSGAITGRYESNLLQTDVIGSYQRVPGTSWILVSEMRFSDVMSPLLSQYVPIVVGGIVILLLIPSAAWAYLMYRQIAPPLIRLNRMMVDFSLSERDPDFPHVNRRDEVGRVYNTFVDLAVAFHSSVSDGEMRQNRLTRNLGLFFETAQLLRTVQEIDTLLEEFVRLLRQDYPGIHYAQIFLVDNQSNTAIMRAGTGEQGRRLLVQGHRLSMDTQTVVGHAGTLGRPVLVVDYEKSPPYTKHEILKQTRTELAVPMIAREQLIGILDLHSYEPSAFSERDFAFFSALATKYATSLLGWLTTTKPMLALETDAATHQNTRVGWQDYYTQRQNLALSLDGKNGQKTVLQEWTALQRQAIQSRKSAVGKPVDEKVAFALPVILRGEVLGAIECTIEATRFHAGLLQTAEELVARFAIAAENARLFEQSQRLIERERLLNEISQKLSVQTDFKQILQVAVKELGLALGTPETTIALNIEPLTSSADSL